VVGVSVSGDAWGEGRATASATVDITASGIARGEGRGSVSATGDVGAVGTARGEGRAAGFTSVSSGLVPVTGLARGEGRAAGRIFDSDIVCRGNLVTISAGGGSIALVSGSGSMTVDGDC
jgi:hypothetical protein